MRNEAGGWEYVKNNYVRILDEKLAELMKSTYYSKGEKYDFQGNYMAFYDGEPVHIGESLNVGKRVGQHLKADSTLVKNLKKLHGDFSMDKLEFRVYENHFGRKDLEEYGMFSLPLINKSHKGRDFAASECTETSDWNLDLISIFTEGERMLLKGTGAAMSDKIPAGAVPGVYMIFRENEPIYIGESINLGQRLATHCRVTRFSTFRRSVAKKIFGFTLKSKAEIGCASSGDTKKFFLTDAEECEINRYIADCQVRFIEVPVGRCELKEYLIEKYNPYINNR